MFFNCNWQKKKRFFFAYFKLQPVGFDQMCNNINAKLLFKSKEKHISINFDFNLFKLNNKKNSFFFLFFFFFLSILQSKIYKKNSNNKKVLKLNVVVACFFFLFDINH